MMEAMSENLAILGAYSDAMARGDRDAVYEFWSPDFVSHVTERVNPAMVGQDVRDQEVEWWTQCHNAFPDMVFSVGLLIEKDDLIVSNWTVKGTHTGTAFYDVEPSGEPVEINGTAILRMRDGKIVEHWGGPHCQNGVGLTHAPGARDPTLRRIHSFEGRGTGRQASADPLIVPLTIRRRLGAGPCGDRLGGCRRFAVDGRGDLPEHGPDALVELLARRTSPLFRHNATSVPYVALVEKGGLGRNGQGGGRPVSPRSCRTGSGSGSGERRDGAGRRRPGPGCRCSRSSRRSRGRASDCRGG